MEALKNPVENLPQQGHIQSTMSSVAGEKKTSVAQRLEALEREFALLREQVIGKTATDKNWQRTAGTFPRDEVTLEAEGYGREWRKQEKAL